MSPRTAQRAFPGADSDFLKKCTIYRSCKSRANEMRVTAHPPAEMRRQERLVEERDRRPGGNSEVELREQQLVVEQTHLWRLHHSSYPQTTATNAQAAQRSMVVVVVVVVGGRTSCLQFWSIHHCQLQLRVIFLTEAWRKHHVHAAGSRGLQHALARLN